eukprot:COSAG06_NODE_1759_length_8453_cov_3.819129_3_plen_60_part_00
MAATRKIRKPSAKGNALALEKVQWYQLPEGSCGARKCAILHLARISNEKRVQTHEQPHN